jgi:ATP-dependent protease HslVU (ClpYQ) peptidase subunit
VSTVTAVKKNGYVAIAADTLVSLGPMKMSAAYNKTCRKIVRVGDSFLGMTGFMVTVQVLESLFHMAGPPPKLSTPSEIFEVFRLVHVRLRDEYFMIPRTDPTDAFEMTHLNVLIANPHGIFTVGGYRTVSEYEKFWAAGSGMEYALGAMHALYEQTDDVVLIAEAGVRAAADFDASTSTPIESRLIRLAPATVEEFDLPLHA